MIIVSIKPEDAIDKIFRNVEITPTILRRPTTQNIYNNKSCY